MDLTALGAFLSGAAAVISAIVSLRLARKRADQECERRFAAFREGLKLGRER